MAPEEAALQLLATSGSPIVGGNPPELGGNPIFCGNSPSSAFVDGVNHDQDQLGGSEGIKLRKVGQSSSILIYTLPVLNFGLSMKTF